MIPKTRLDPVVRVREYEERRAKEAFAAAAAATRDALLKLETLRRAAERERDAPTSPRIEEWALRQASYERMLESVRLSEAAHREAEAREVVAKAAFETAHREAEAVRRAVEVRREALILERERAERKELDALAQLQFIYHREAPDDD